ncbi:MAG: hypothetical protein ABI083_20110 [Lapillicoccus sp.]
MGTDEDEPSESSSAEGLALCCGFDAPGPVEDFEDFEDGEAGEGVEGVGVDRPDVGGGTDGVEGADARADASAAGMAAPATRALARVSAVPPTARWAETVVTSRGSSKALAAMVPRRRKPTIMATVRRSRMLRR